MSTSCSSSLIETLQLNLEAYVEVSSDISPVSFQHAIKIFINKPQVLNKWVAGSILCPIEVNPISELLLSHQFNHECREFLSKSNKVFKNLKYIIANDASFHQVLFYPLLTNTDDKSTKTKTNTKYSSIRLPHLFQYDPRTQRINMFVSKLEEEEKEDERKQIKWLEMQLLAKLKSWCGSSMKLDDQFSCTQLNTLTFYENMVDDYVKLYQQMKAVYFQRHAGTWLEMTNTDPEKYGFLILFYSYKMVTSGILEVYGKRKKYPDSIKMIRYL